VVVIGDTVHDIACARPYGARSIAVATGKFFLDFLLAARPDLAVNDLVQGAQSVWDIFWQAHHDFSRLGLT
jgi:phosphoglycolate phosphatase-like HAD superfamily hydrolase